MKFRITRVGLSILAAAVLAACGGGGSGSNPVATPTTFSGTVIDGYIEGAPVCLDLNGNQACDAGEPAATSKADGTYSLDITGLTTKQIKTTHLLTLVPDTAFDADDIVAGVKKTLAQAGKAPFTLMAPASAFVSADGTTISSAVISPLTTLVSHEMIVGNGTLLVLAEAAVRQNMGLAPDANLRQNFVANGNTDLHNQARLVAAVIGEVTKQAKLVKDTSNRDALLAALGYLKQNMTALQAQVSNATGTSVLEKVTTALAMTALIPAPTNLIGDAKKLTASSAVDMTATLVDGFYDGTFNDCGVASPNCIPVTYRKIFGSSGQWFSQAYEQTLTGWSPSTNSDMFLTDKGWVADGNIGTIIADDHAVTATTTSTGQSFRLSARMVDVSDLKAADVAGLKLPQYASSSPVSFAKGSKLYWLQQSPLNDSYRLRKGNTLAKFSCANSNAGATPIGISGTLSIGTGTTGTISINGFYSFSNIAAPGAIINNATTNTSYAGGQLVLTPGATITIANAGTTPGTLSGAINLTASAPAIPASAPSTSAGPPAAPASAPATSAQVIATPGGLYKPTIEAAANGVPIVQITAPSAAGVSLNQYEQFNVAAQGLIFNNSPVLVQTQQAGWISGNANLVGSPARIILNEVNASAPSTSAGPPATPASAPSISTGTLSTTKIDLTVNTRADINLTASTPTIPVWTPLTAPISATCTSIEYTRLADFIAANLTDPNNPIMMMMNGLIFSFDSAAAGSLTGTVSLWSITATGVKIDRTAPYTIKTVMGQEVLIIKASTPARAGQNLIFAIQGGKLYHGDFTPGGLTLPASQYFNKTGMESVLGGYTTLKVGD